ncbi:hypothetical protein [Vallitalea sp.]|jgi:hypothetical protein|uniref:hypothetical protein n=1 Tax=Vallitalea sp. TaxID=1882829 RepID=UPI0025FBB570|nr:hypothetical protein [Vallitalea sp.]MCT4687280.1 hypothetical protein [Vallitalea sp.]
MSDISIIQHIDNRNNREYKDSIKEGIRMSVISMAMSVGTFKVNLTVNKSDELVKKKSKNHQTQNRIKEAIRAKNQKLDEYSMCNFLI